MSGPLAFVGRKLRGALRYSPLELALVPIAITLLGLARLAILALPFRIYARLLGDRIDAASELPITAERERQRARSIGRSVRASASVTPWKAVCLPQAMAAAALLRLFGISSTTYFGLAPGEPGPREAPMRAHAWLQVGDLTVTGAPIDPALRVVATFGTGQSSGRHPA